MESGTEMRAQAKAVADLVLKADAEEVAGCAESAMDGILEAINDGFGEQISSVFSGDGADDESSDPDVVTLIFLLVISKLGISFTVNIDWSLYNKAFGWLQYLSVLTPTAPHVAPATVATVTFVFLLLLQPACLGRMLWLAREHSGAEASPLPSLVQFFTRFMRTELRPYNSILTPLLIVLWVAFLAMFIPTLIYKAHMAAGLIFVLLGIPATYLHSINWGRTKTWEYVYLRCADVVRHRQYQNLCLQEGTFMLFVFVAAYTFVLNYFIALMAHFSAYGGGQRFLIVVGFILYAVLPIAFLYRVIADVNADRTFRVFRQQLVSPFVDQSLYMKLVLLAESALFAILMLLGDGAVAQLLGGLLVTTFFFAWALVYRPYEEDMENYSDIIARACVWLTLLFGLIIQISGGGGMDVILILISIVTTMWFMYTLDIKDIIMNRFFLLLQLYAQSKAVRYTKTAIQKMPAARVRKLTQSPIELFVLSSAQRIHFATLRKDDFFEGSIAGLADVGVTWLDLQQMGCSVLSLRAQGFTDDEMMEVDAQLDDMGDRSDIQRLFEDVYAGRLASLGAEDRATLLSLHDLGVFYRDIGEHVLSMDRLQLSYKARGRVFGLEDEDTLVSQQYIGEYYEYLGRQSEGLQMLRGCLKIREGGEDTKTLDCMRALGSCLLKVGLGAEALQILEQRYIRVVQATVGEKMRADHPCTLAARLDYAEALADSGLYTLVPSLRLGPILNRQKTIFGDCAQTLGLMDRYADLLIKMGDNLSAVRLLQECVSEKTATLGPQHTGTIRSTFALAGAYLTVGRNKEVEKLCLAEILNSQMDRLGETHPSTISSSVKLGALYMNMDRTADSLELFRTCHSVRVKALGRDHELTLGVANNIAAVLDGVGKYQEAREVYEETLQLTESRLGDTHLCTTAVMLNLGQLYQRMGDLQLAHQMYTETLSRCTEAYGELHPQSLIAFDFVGCLLLVQDRFQEAHDIFEKCAKMKEGIYEDSHPICLSTLDNLASCKQRLGQNDEALAIYEKVCRLRALNYGERHQESIKARAGMAIVLAQLNRAGEALAILNTCVQDAQAILGAEHLTVMEYYGVIGYIYAICGAFEEGLRFTNVSLAGTVKLFGDYHHLTKKLLERKAYILSQMGRTAEAAQCTELMHAEPPAGGPLVGASTKAGATEDTLSPLQQQIRAEQGEAEKSQSMLVLKIDALCRVAESKDAAKVDPLLADLYASLSSPPTKDATTFLHCCNLAAVLLNNGLAAQALQLMQTVYPIIAATFDRHAEVVLPALDMLGKCYLYTSNVEGAVPIMEQFCALSRAQPASPAQAAALQAAEELLVQCYGHTQQHQKVIALHTAQYDHHSRALGEHSEEAITALNSRAMYHFALRDFDKSKEDHKRVYAGLCKLQGAEHEETTASLDGFKKLYADHQMTFEL